MDVPLGAAETFSVQRLAGVPLWWIGKFQVCTTISAQKETYYVLIPRIEEHANSHKNTPIIDGSGLPESRSVIQIS